MPSEIILNDFLCEQRHDNAGAHASSLPSSRPPSTPRALSSRWSRRGGNSGVGASAGVERVHVLGCAHVNMCNILIRTHVYSTYNNKYGGDPGVGAATDLSCTCLMDACPYFMCVCVCVCVCIHTCIRTCTSVAAIFGVGASAGVQSGAQKRFVRVSHVCLCVRGWVGVGVLYTCLVYACMYCMHVKHLDVGCR